MRPMHALTHFRSLRCLLVELLIVDPQYLMTMLCWSATSRVGYGTAELCRSINP